jgi:hypothetical protein
MAGKSKAKVRLVAHGKSKPRSTATPRVRKIRHSPVADPKLVYSFYLAARKLRKQRLEKDIRQEKLPAKGAHPEVPFVTAVR